MTCEVKGEEKVLLEELKPGLRIDGLIPAQVITVVFAQWHGTDALEGKPVSRSDG